VSVFSRTGTATSFTLVQPTLTSAITLVGEIDGLGDGLSISQDGSLIFVGAPGYQNEGDAGLLTVFVRPASFTTQPSPQTVTVGSSATFTSAISAAATGLYAVQWSVDTSGGGAPLSKKRGTFSPIAGATSPTFTINPTVAVQNGNVYQASYSLAGVSANSNSALLTLTLAASASGDPHVSVDGGRSFEFEGKLGSVYNLVSSSAVQVNMQLGKVRANRIQWGPGEWMVKVGIVLSSGQTLVIDTTNASMNQTLNAAAFELLIDGRRELLTESRNVSLAPVFVREQCRLQRVSLEQQQYWPRVAASTLGVASSDPIAARLRLVLESHLEVQVLVVEYGYSSLRGRWLSDVPRRWLDVKVLDLSSGDSTCEAAAASRPPPLSGVLGQALSTSNGSARNSMRSVSDMRNDNEAWIKELEHQHRVDKDDLLGWSMGAIDRPMVARVM